VNLLKWIVTGVFALMIFCLGFIAAIDKKKLAYSVANNLQKHLSVGLVFENVEGKLLGFEMQGVKIYYASSLIASSQSLYLGLGGVQAQDMQLENMLASMMPKEVESFNYSVFDPMKFQSVGAFGIARATLDTQSMQINLVIEPTDAMQKSNAARFLKKQTIDDKEVMVYELKL